MCNVALSVIASMVATPRVWTSALNILNLHYAKLFSEFELVIRINVPLQMLRSWLVSQLSKQPICRHYDQKFFNLLAYILNTENGSHERVFVAAVLSVYCKVYCKVAFTEGYTYGTNVFDCFGEVSALQRFKKEIFSTPNKRCDCCLSYKVTSVNVVDVAVNEAPTKMILFCKTSSANFCAALHFFYFHPHNFNVLNCCW